MEKAGEGRSAGILEISGGREGGKVPVPLTLVGASGVRHGRGIRGVNLLDMTGNGCYGLPWGPPSVCGSWAVSLRSCIL